MPAIWIAALLNKFAYPELLRWLAHLHAEGREVTEAEARLKLGEDVDEGNAEAARLLQLHGG